MTAAKVFVSVGILASIPGGYMMASNFETAARSSPGVLEIVEGLGDQRQAGIEGVRSYFGVEFRKLEDMPDQTEVFASTGRTRFGAIRSVTVSIDHVAGSTPTVLMAIDTEVSCVTLKDITARFGQFANMVVPTPRQPANAPIRYDYPVPWGLVSFLVSRGAKTCLETAKVVYKV